MKKKVTCIVFLIIIFTLPIISGLNKSLNMYRTIDKSDGINLSEVYKCVEAGVDGATKLDRYKNAFINYNGLFQKLIGRRTVEDIDKDNKIIKLNNDKLTFVSSSLNDATSKANSIKKLNDYLKKENIPLLYVQAPSKISKYEDELPKGVKSYDNEYADNYISQISDEIDVIDLREEMYNDGLNQADYFFNTDHHWTPEGAFYGFQKVSLLLKEKYGFKFDKKFTDLNNYDKIVYEDWFLGSQGKRVGKYYAGVDDISLYIPKFETNFYNSLPADNYNRSGEWSDALISKHHIDKKDYFKANPYAMYIGGDYSLNIIKNNLSQNDKKVLLIRDSFGCAFTPFLSLICSELDTVDFRYYKQGSIIDYIEESKPDIVIALFNPSGIQEMRLK